MDGKDKKTEKRKIFLPGGILPIPAMVLLCPDREKPTPAAAGRGMQRGVRDREAPL